MEAHDLDVLVLGREANVRYVAGCAAAVDRRARGRSAPGCVVVRATGEIHLLSTWDEGVPEEIPHEHLYGITWNPMTLVEVLRASTARRRPRRVGTDALSPSFAQLLPMAFPDAELVDGEQRLRAARRIKTPDEVDAIRGAIGVAERALAAAVAELRPGVTERQLTGVFMEAMAASGVTTPATQDVAWITSREHPWRRGPRDRRVAAGRPRGVRRRRGRRRLRRRGGPDLAGRRRRAPAPTALFRRCE